MIDEEMLEMPMLRLQHHLVRVLRTPSRPAAWLIGIEAELPSRVKIFDWPIEETYFTSHGSDEQCPHLPVGKYLVARVVRRLEGSAPSAARIIAVYLEKQVREIEAYQGKGYDVAWKVFAIPEHWEFDLLKHINPLSKRIPIHQEIRMEEFFQ